MQKTIKRALSVLLCAALLLGALPLLAFAADPTSGSCGSGVTWRYNMSTKTLTISGSGVMSDYSTSTYGEYDLPVTTAGWRPYYMTAKKLVIENGVTGIGANAFYFLYGLESVSIPASVTSIGEYAFAGCPNLTAVKISDVAAWCGITFVNSVSNPLYYGHNLYLNDALMTDLVIPNGVTKINMNAFTRCTNITGLTVPAGVTTIDYYAFGGCIGLTDINLPDGLTTINSGAFECCTGLTTVTLPNSITALGSEAFAYCVNLTGINVPDGVPDINSEMFLGCVNLKSVTIGSGVTYVSNNAFSVGCSAETLGYLQSDYERAVENGETLTDASIGYVSLDTIQTIFDHADGSLTDVYYRGTEDNWSSVYISTYGNDALINATKHFAPGFFGLIYLEGADNTISILDCDDWLAEIAIPAGIDGGTVTAIGNEAFKGNNMMTNLTIPRTVTSIGKKIFQATVPDYYHSMTISSINSLKATYEQYGLDVRDYFRNRMEIDGPIFLETVRYDEMIYYVDHGEWPTNSLTDVYFEGTEEEWDQITIDPDNAILLGAELHFLELDHSHVYTSAVVSEQNCTTDGVTTYTCSCGDVKTVTKPALGHDYTSEVTTEPTCSETGVRTYTCTRCGNSYTESIPTVAHTYESVVTTEATCTEPGLLTKTCSECHFVTTEVIPALGHNFAVTVTKEPTCAEEGSCIKTCSRCNYSCTEALPTIDHIDEDDDGTCDNCGSEDIVKSDINVGETKTVEIVSNQVTTLRFVPKVTGTYTLASGANADTYCYLYDADMNQITYNDDYGTVIGTDFALTYDLVKGQTYYYGCRYYSRYRSGSYPVTLTLDSVLETLDATAGKDAVIDTMNGAIYGLAPNVTDPSAYFTAKDGFTYSTSPSGTSGESNVYSTGSIVRVYSGDVMIASYKLVLFGDINGDGWYDGTDAYFVRLTANGMIPQTALNAAQRKACDANHDGAIDAADVAIIEQAGLLLNAVDQTLPQDELETNSVYLEYCGLIDQTIEMIEPDEAQPIVIERLQPEAQSLWSRIMALLSVVLNWLLGVFKAA
ncbi:MAG: leucine-rich repeat protein [Clostridia bacterium]|nr:leucine-rich repeat protein [Clostridia bacterium]